MMKKEANIENYLNNLINEYPSIISEINDTTLLLTFKDFLKEFSSLAVCFTKNWEEIHLRGKFVKIGENVDNNQVMSKWYYNIILEKQTNIIISLFQDEDKFKENESRKQLLDISISILKLDLNKNEINHIQTYDFSLTSNLQIELNLPAGQYIIVPRTSGCLFGRPLLNNIINNDNNNKTNLYNIETKTFSNIFINTIKDIFKKFDILLNRNLNFIKFKQFLDCVKTDNETFNEKNLKTL